MKNNQKGFANLVLIGVIVVLIAVGGYFILSGKSKEQEIKEISSTDTSNSTYWKTYTNEEYGFEFQYPEKLKLMESNSKVSLNHTLPYRGSACDMTGGFEPDLDITDFKVTFEILHGVVSSPYTDGEYKKGNLKGVWALEGAEGCGDTKYYFPVEGDKTLLVTRENIQILSGIRNNADEIKVILEISEAINKEQNQVIFDQILSTFKFTK